MPHWKAALLLLVLAVVTSTACTRQVTPAAAPAQARTLTVLAAASLTAPYTDLGNSFEAANPGVTVVFSFAGSQELAQQLAQGAQADVFASASQKQMEAAVTAGRVNASASRVFARNRLVVIFPNDNPGRLATLQDLAKAGLKLDLADQSVPVGQYSLDFLDKAGADPDFAVQFKEAVLRNVVSYETNVKAVVSKVALGEADAGIVYLTDLAGAAADNVGSLEIPDALNTIATYPIAPVADSQNAELAQAFIDLVLSVEGQQVLTGYRFISLP